METLQECVDTFTYLGIFIVLLLGSLGVPIPEEIPIIAAALLSHEGVVRWWLAAAALFGVPLMFGLAYFFTDQIQAIMADVHRAERWLALSLACWRLPRCWASACGDGIIAS